MKANTISPSVYGGLSGCGDITGWDSNGDPIVDTASCSAGIPGTENTSWPTTNTTNGTTSTSDTVNVATAVSSLSNAFANIFKAIQPVPAGCTQVAGPYGVSVQCAGQGQSTLPLGLTSLTSGGSGSLLLIGGAVLIVILISKKG